MIVDFIKVDKVEIRTYNDKQMYLITDSNGNIWGDWGNKFNKGRMLEGKRYRVEYIPNGKYKNIKYFEERV